MGAKTFDVLISGHTLSGFSTALASKNLAELFSINVNKAALLLQQQERVVRRGVDLNTAEKWQRALQHAGIEALFVPSEEASAPQPAPNNADAIDLDLVGTIRIGGEGFIGGFSVAPKGAQIGEETSPVSRVTTSALADVELAPAGADIDTLPDTRKPVEVDISHLKLV